MTVFAAILALLVLQDFLGLKWVLNANESGNIEIS